MEIYEQFLITSINTFLSVSNLFLGIFNMNCEIKKIFRFNLVINLSNKQVPIEERMEFVK